MKAFIYSGINQQKIEDRPKPSIDKPSDAIVRVTKPVFAEPIYIS